MRCGGVVCRGGEDEPPKRQSAEEWQDAAGEKEVGSAAVRGNDVRRESNRRSQ